MITMGLSEIAKIVGGELHGGSNSLVTQAPVFDSREAIEGSLFLALVGENLDGHDFVQEAFDKGAVAALTTRVIVGDCIVVTDVLKALSLLASHIRSILNDLQVIGITGSQGKTSTKDLLSVMLGAYGKVVATVGSFNNELGLPLTLLKCDESTRYCIVEMGARHLGDIEKLCKIAKPTIGVVLKVGTAHIGEFGSQEIIALAKSELISALGTQGVAILGSYDAFTPAMRSLHHGKVLTFGERSNDDVRATDIEMRDGRPHFELVTSAGRSAVGMRLIGAHQVSNALAAAAVASALGLPIELIASSLSTAENRSKWRMELHDLGDFLLINDAYNANPDSMAAALKALALFAQERGGRSWAFLGKMAELGASTKAEHLAISALAQELGIDHLVSISAPYGSSNKVSSGMVIHGVSTIEGALALAQYFEAGDVALVKASRSEHLEVLAEALANKWRENEAKGGVLE